MPFYTDNNHTGLENDELIRRLRELEWPSVSRDLRKRCWEEFSRRLDDGHAPAAAQPTGRATGERYAFSRRGLSPGVGQSPVAGSRMAIAAGLSRSPQRARLLSAA